MNLKSKNTILGIVVILILVFLFGYHSGKGSQPEKVVTEIKEVEKIIYVEKKAEANVSAKLVKYEKKKDGSIKSFTIEGSGALALAESNIDVETFKSVYHEQLNSLVGVYLGAGLDARLKPFASGILTYKNYAATAGSDFILD